MRNPGPNATLYGLLTLAGIVLVLLGIADMRETGKTGSPLLMLGLFPVLFGPIFFIHYLSKIRTFRDMQSGRSAVARWTVPAEQFNRFCEQERSIPAGSITTNFYSPPRNIPAGGVEVIFSDAGVLIGGGYFPLSPKGGRGLQGVRYIGSDPPSIEFETAMTTLARTSSATTRTIRTVEMLRVPVATDARQQAGEVVHRFEAIIGR